MAIVLPCSMTPREFAAAGREVEMPRPRLSELLGAMSFWGFYSRPLRIGDEIRLLVHRARCAAVPDDARPDPRLRGARPPRRHRGDRARDRTDGRRRHDRGSRSNAPGCLTRRPVVGGGVSHPGRSSWQPGSSPPPSPWATSSHAFPPVWSRSPCVPSRLLAERADAGSGLAVTTGASPTASSAGICCRPTPIHPGSAAEGRL